MFSPRIVSSLVLVIAGIAGSMVATAATFTPALPADVPAGLGYDTTQPPVNDPEAFAGKRVAILAAHGVQASEIQYPYEYLTARGASVDIVAPSWSEGRVLVVEYVRPTLWVSVDKTFEQAATEEYDLILLTGGAWNSTVVRNDQAALSLVQRHYEAGRLLASICSAAQVLINAGIAKDTELTGTPTVRLDLENAGARYLDQAVVVSGNLITSRSPDDLLPFVTAIGAQLGR